MFILTVIALNEQFKLTTFDPRVTVFNDDEDEVSERCYDGHDDDEDEVSERCYDGHDDDENEVSERWYDGHNDYGTLSRRNKGSIDEPEDKGSRSSEPGNWNNARGEKKTRFCHYYQRNGCTTPKCPFLHDIAPVCQQYLKGVCRRRFCMYRHEQKKNFQDGRQTIPSEMDVAGWEHQKHRNHYKEAIHEKQQTRMYGSQLPHQSEQKLYSWNAENSNKRYSEETNMEQRLPHHRYRYTKKPATENPHQQILSQRIYPLKKQQQI